jgi:hypothetical protein
MFTTAGDTFLIMGASDGTGVSPTLLGSCAVAVTDHAMMLMATKVREKLKRCMLNPNYREGLENQYSPT